MRTLLLILLVTVPLAAQPKQEAAPQKETLTSELSSVLADTFVLYTEALNFHWNVTGEQFFTLHDFFGQQYEALSEGIDLIAEQIRMLGQTPPSTLQAFLDHTSLKEPQGTMTARQMVAKYLADQEKMIAKLENMIPQTEKQGVMDLLIERLRFHEKTAWMLRSYLEK